MQAPRHSGGSRSSLQPPQPPLEAPPRPLPVGLGPRLLPLGCGESLASFRILEQGRVPLVIPSFYSSEALAAASPTSTTPLMPTLHGSNVPRMQESLWHQSAHPLFLGSSISDSAPSSAPDSPTPPRPPAPELPLVRLSRPLLRLCHRETVEGPSASYGLRLQQASSPRPRLAPPRPCTASSSRSLLDSASASVPTASTSACSPRPRTASSFRAPPRPTPSAPASAALQRNSRGPVGLVRPPSPASQPPSASLLPLSLIQPPAPNRCLTPPRPRSQPCRPWLAPLRLGQPPSASALDSFSC